MIYKYDIKMWYWTYNIRFIIIEISIITIISNNLRILT